jgi:hypothetical protein
MASEKSPCSEELNNQDNALRLMSCLLPTRLERVILSFTYDENMHDLRFQTTTTSTSMEYWTNRTT